MNRKPPADDTSWESDAVWALLDEAAPPKARARFADDVVRATRTAPEPAVWWRRILYPAPLAGLATAGTAVAIAFFSLSGSTDKPAEPVAATPPEERFAIIQSVAETEMLIAAMDHMDEFSDHELASLIGF